MIDRWVSIADNYLPHRRLLGANTGQRQPCKYLHSERDHDNVAIPCLTATVIKNIPFAIPKKKKLETHACQENNLDIFWAM